MYFKVLRNGKPANSSCRQPKGKAFLQSTGHFRQFFSWISRNPGSSWLKTTGLRQSGAKHFGKRQDCSNPEPNTFGNGKIAAIRSQTLLETARLRQSGAKHFWKRQDCSNPAFPGQDEPGFPKSAHSPNTACPSPSPNESTRGPDCRNPEPHHAPRPHLSAAAPMPAAAGRLSPRLRRCLPMGARASPRQTSGGGNAGFRAQSGGDPSEAE